MFRANFLFKFSKPRIPSLNEMISFLSTFSIPNLVVSIVFTWPPSLDLLRSLMILAIGVTIVQVGICFWNAAAIVFLNRYLFFG